MTLLYPRVVFFTFCICYCLNLAESAEDGCKLITQDDRARVYLEKLHPLIGKTFSTVRDNDHYEITICSETPTKCPQNPNFASAVRKHGETECNVIGRYNASMVLGNDGWILLKYYSGDNVSIGGNMTIEARTQIMITCDPDDHSGTLRTVEAKMDGPNTDLFYWFELKTELICKKPGLSAGSILCILFFTSAGIYFLFGFLYSRFIVGAQGLEQIPNYSFWKNFGKLQAEGCDFACRCGERQEAKMYRGIGENNEDRDRSGRDDRDDHLLPM